MRAVARADGIESCYNVCVSAVAGIGGLNNAAKRNVKADQLRLVPRDNLNKETESNEDTETRHCRNILLWPVGFRTLLSDVTFIIVCQFESSSCRLSTKLNPSVHLYSSQAL